MSKNSKEALLAAAKRTAQAHGYTGLNFRDLAKEVGIRAANTFIYVRGYPSKEERDKRLKAVRDDPEFVQVVTKQEESPDTKLVLKVHNIDMTPNGNYTTITLAK